MHDVHLFQVLNKYYKEQQVECLKFEPRINYLQKVTWIWQVCLTSGELMADFYGSGKECPPGVKRMRGSPTVNPVY